MDTSKLKNLCAPIPASLHERVRQKQGESGKNLGEYMTWLISEFYKQEGMVKVKDGQRTVAFQVDADLFDRFKEFLKTKGIKQNAFFVECIQRALAADSAAKQNEGQEGH
ncbi:hypothetical protein [uncultured Dysosmobacter sp.]|uniref:hypothetical protein n=1 Tax=uncultured Dysosmobacter sp. TaxID=2591384 RepID=UPI00262BE56D|nr:hypothetical protein [uncultured Dysosmobacter sp.]